MQGSKITVIGASIADISGQVSKTLILGDSNQGKVTITPGGVGRNVAENLARLDCSIEFISAFGTDLFGTILTDKCKETNTKIEHSYFSDTESTPIYLSVNNIGGDLALAVADTEVTRHITPDFIRSKHEILNSSEILVFETNLTQETIDYICETYSHKALFIDLVSSQKSLKIINLIDKFHTIKPNLIEAEALSGISYKSDDDLPKMLDFFLNKGVSQVFITLGQRGVYYGNAEERGFYESVNLEPVSTCGAGDSFLSGVIFAFSNKKNIRESAQFGTAMSIVTLAENSAVSDKVNTKYINDIITKYKLC